jgi:hypothetical protein
MVGGVLLAGPHIAGIKGRKRGGIKEAGAINKYLRLS